MTETAMWVIGQTLVLLVVIVGSFMRGRERLTRVEERCKHIESNTNGLKDDHKELAKKVDGISRHVAKMEAQS